MNKPEDDKQILRSEVASLRLELVSLQNNEDRIKQKIAEIDQMIRSVLEEDNTSESKEPDNSRDQWIA